MKKVLPQAIQAAGAKTVQVDRPDRLQYFLQQFVILILMVMDLVMQVIREFHQKQLAALDLF